MITPSTIYWATRCDNFCGFTLAIALILSVVMVFTLAGFIIRATDRSDELARLCVKLSPLTIFLFFVSWLAFSFIPTTKECAAMIIVPAIANNEKLRDTGDKLYELAVEWINELHPKK